MKITLYFGTNNFEGIGKVLIIPATAESIGDGAFTGLLELEKIDFSENDKINEVPLFMFAGCSNLQEVIFSENITKIGEWSFRECKSLKKIVIPDSVEEIGRGAFYKTGLEEVTFPKNDKFIKINSYTFSSTLIKNLEIPNSVVKIDYEAFSIIKINKLTIGDNLKEIDISSFKNANIGDIEISDKNTFLKKYNSCIYSNDYKKIFVMGNNLQAFNLHSSLEEFNCYFPNNIEIDNMNFPKKIKNISNLSEYPNIKNITIDENNPYLTCVDGVIYTKKDDNGISNIINAINSVENLILRDNLNENIGTIKSISGFSSSKLKSIDLAGTSIETVTDQTFYECKKLENIVFSNSLKTVKNQAFTNTLIKSIVIPEGTTTLETLAFFANGKLENVKLPSTLKNVNNFFPRCEAIKNVEIAENDKFSTDGIMIFNKDKSILIAAPYFKEGMKIPSTVKEINQFALSYLNYKDISLSIDIPNSIEVIHLSAFHYSESLIEVNIQSGILKIEGGAFESCNNLKKINIDKPKNSISGAPWGAPKGILAVNWKK